MESSADSGVRQEHENEKALGLQLIEACDQGDLAVIDNLLSKGAPAYHQEVEGGTSALMHAANGGYLEICQKLLAAGAPWNALDRQGKCAGEWAMEGGPEAQAVVDLLVDHAVVCEMLLGAAQNDEEEEEEGEGGSKSDAREAESAKYLQGRIRYEKDRLVDEEDEGVMMQWEGPLMEAHADILCGGDGKRDVLNVGYGMGIIDRAIQARGCGSHTIIEAHPDVLKKMEGEGWMKKDNIEVLKGRWQEVLPPSVEAGRKFDAIFFDTYAEHYRDMQAFHAFLPKLLRPGGSYSYFNGLAPDNIFFHAVACQLVKLELESLGFEVDFATVEVEGGAEKEEIWAGLRRRYWHGRTKYYLPIATYKGNDNEIEGGKASAIQVEGAKQERGVGGGHGGGIVTAMADDTLVGEADIEGREEPAEVLLRAGLDSEAGGISWKPLTADGGLRGRADPVCLLQLRCWYPPMLNDTRRHALLAKAVHDAISTFKAQHDGQAPTVLDVGCGTGLLSLEAAKAGAAKVIACETFPAIAKVAKATIKQAGLEGSITVVSQSSFHLVAGGQDGLVPEGRVDVVITELLDSALLGEGYLTSIRDLAVRGIIRQDTLIVPTKAKVWAQLIQCHDLSSYHHIPGQPACSGGGRPLPLYLAPPAETALATTIEPEGVNPSRPIPSKALSAPFRLLDIDFSKACRTGDLTVAEGQQQHAGGPISLGLSCDVPVTATGDLHGVMMYWELEAWPGHDTYSTVPRDPAVDPLWQDHWKPCVWPNVAEGGPKRIDEGKETVTVQGAHDDQGIWISLGEKKAAEKVLREGPSFCTCGQHPPVVDRDGSGFPFGRILELNDSERQQAQARALSIALSSSPADTSILDISDGATLALLAASAVAEGGGAASRSIISLESHPWYAAVARAKGEEKGIDVWQGAAAGEEWQKEKWGEVGCLIGDGYYHKIGLNRPVWNWLNFWILRTALEPILKRDAVILPFQARVMAALIECFSLARNHSTVSDIGGWNHEAYKKGMEDAGTRAEADEDKDLPVSLALHPHRLLTSPALVMRFDLHRPINFSAPAMDDEAYCRTKRRVPVENSGTAHAVAIWVDVDLTFEAASVGEPDVVSGYEGQAGRQMLRFIEGGKGKEVQSGMHFLAMTGVLDVVNPGLCSEFTIEQGSGKEEEEGDYRS